VLPDWATAQPAAPPAVSPRLSATTAATADRELKAGKFGVVRSLLRALARGPEAKAILDTVVDACRHAPGLRVLGSRL